MTQNKIQDALLDDLISSTRTKNIVDWVNTNRSIKGKPWEWVSKETTQYGQTLVKDFRFLLPIYLDDHHTIVVKKARQLALSEYGINWIMNLTEKYDHTTAIHVFPKESQAKTFSNVRLTPIFDKVLSPKLYRRLTNPDLIFGSAMQAAANVKVKQFVNHSNYILSFIAGPGSKSTDALSISADFIFLDEAADLPHEKTSDVIECMSASSYKLLRIVGTPDFTDTEFDRRYEASDQREWFVKCNKCGLEQILKFDQDDSTIMSIIPTSSVDSTVQQYGRKYYYACTNCKAELDRSCDNGKWVATNDDDDVHGYHPTQLMASWISADEIMRKKKNSVKYPHKFHNFVLGETYAGGEKPITTQKLLNCRIDAGTVGTRFANVSIGVDWGNQSHYVVLASNRMNEAYLLDYGVWTDSDVLSHTQDMSDLMKTWAAEIAICDSGYGKVQNQRLFKMHPGKVYSCFYKESVFSPTFEIIDKANGLYLPKDKFQYHVTVDHTSMCDNVLSMLDTHRFKLLMAENDDLVPCVSPLRDFMDNVTLAKVLKTTSSSGKTVKRWIITPSHFFAAMAYALIGLDSFKDADAHTGTDGNFHVRGYR